jgi:hypothetical protein
MSQIQLRHNNRAGVSQKHRYNWASYILISALTLYVPFQLPASQDASGGGFQTPKPTGGSELRQDLVNVCSYSGWMAVAAANTTGIATKRKPAAAVTSSATNKVTVKLAQVCRRGKRTKLKRRSVRPYKGSLFYLINISCKFPPRVWPVF